MPAGASWWHHAVVYQVYVRSFADARGDGIGDLDGIRSRLGYLETLGIDAIWLTPCYPSPQHDHGYDVADYFSIDPDYGDLHAFDRLVADARDRGIRVLMDVVPNHCSSHHPWFSAALAAGPGSRERARFWFRDGRGRDGDEPPNNWQAVFGGPAWTRVVERDGSPGQWYLHTFTPWQPDFDWSHHDVVEHFDHMLTFWFDRGVEGFRCDAVSVVGKDRTLPDAPAVRPGARPTDVAGNNPHAVHRPEGHQVWRRWRALVDDYAAHHPGRHPYLVAEAYTPRRPDILEQYLAPDEFHQAFAFDLLLAGWRADQLRDAIVGSLGIAARTGAVPSWTLENHDAQRCVTRYGRADATEEAAFTGNNLVWSDAPVDLAVGTRRARAAALVVLALPGTAYLYQGEELGLPEVLDLPDHARQDPIFRRTGGMEAGRDGCRVPLPWTVGAAGGHGFAPAVGAAPWLPQPDGWGRWAVEAQEADPDSMLHLHRRALRVRRTHPGFAGGELTWVPEPAADVLAFTRGDVLVVVNTTGATVALEADLVAGRTLAACSLPGHDDPLAVPPDTAVWLAPPG